MTKMHLSDGQERKCDAKTPEACPLRENGERVPHFQTKAEARDYIVAQAAAEHPDHLSEKTQRKHSETVENHSQNDENFDDIDAEYERKLRTYDVPAYKEDEMRRALDKINEKLAKNGVEGRFNATFTPYTEVLKDNDGGLVSVERMKIELDRPKVSFNGFTFMARVEEVSPGNFIAYTAPGVEMNGYRPESMNCEHCNKVRHRSKVYVVQDENGNYKTVGGQCVQLYTGMSPAGLSAIEWDEFASDSDPDWGSRGNFHGVEAYNSDHTLQIAYALTEREGYKKADNWDDGGETTKGTVAEIARFYQTGTIVGVSPEKERILAARYREILDEADKVSVKDVRKDIDDALQDVNGDWGDNLRTLMNENFVTGKQMGIFVSSMALLNRYKERKRQKPWSRGFIGSAKEKVKQVPAEVKKVQADYVYYGGREQTVYKIMMQTEDGHKVFWSTSSASIPEKGDKIVFDATIKDTSTWNDIDSTRIKNAKWQKLDAPAAD